MSISYLDLIQASSRYSSLGGVKSLTEANSRGVQTAFLCHSHKDQMEARGLQVLLRESGWDVYIDWQDSTMPDKPDRVTAEKIQSKIRSSNWFVFLATPNSMSSRWCPWEIGYADGKKPLSSILVLLTTSGGSVYGNEYLDLYRQLSLTTQRTWAIFEAKTQAFITEARHARPI